MLLANYHFIVRITNTYLKSLNLTLYERCAAITDMMMLMIYTMTLRRTRKMKVGHNKGRNFNNDGVT